MTLGLPQNVTVGLWRQRKSARPYTLKVGTRLAIVEGMKTRVMAEAKNEKDGVTAIVAEAEGGFSLAIRDDDSGNFFDGVIIYPTLDAALAKLNRAAGL